GSRLAIVELCQQTDEERMDDAKDWSSALFDIFRDDGEYNKVGESSARHSDPHHLNQLAKNICLEVWCTLEESGVVLEGLMALQEQVLGAYICFVVDARLVNQQQVVDFKSAFPKFSPLWTKDTTPSHGIWASDFHLTVPKKLLNARIGRVWLHFLLIVANLHLNSRTNFLQPWGNDGG
ncbi:OLC1v1016672C1, partial [Oldenlandia corymbosa var. corymbosa]